MGAPLDVSWFEQLNYDGDDSDYSVRSSELLRSDYSSYHDSDEGADTSEDQLLPGGDHDHSGSRDESGRSGEGFSSANEASFAGNSRSPSPQVGGEDSAEEGDPDSSGANQRKRSLSPEESLHGSEEEAGSPGERDKRPRQGEDLVAGSGSEMESQECPPGSHQGPSGVGSCSTDQGVRESLSGDRHDDPGPEAAIARLAGLPGFTPSRYFVCTINQSKQWPQARLLRLRQKAAAGEIPLCEHASGQFEVGATGRKHLHLFLRFSTRKTTGEVIQALDPSQTGNSKGRVIGSGIYAKSCAAKNAVQAEEYCNKSEDEDSYHHVDRKSRFTWDSGHDRRFQAQYENGLKSQATNRFFEAYQWGVTHIFTKVKSKSEVLAKTMTFPDGGDHMKIIEDCYDYYRRCEKGIELERRRKKAAEVQLLPWQAKAVDLLMSQDNRKVLRVVNARGNMGKSFLVRYLEDRFPGECFATDPCGKIADILYAMDDIGQQVKYVCLDVPRTSVVNFNIAMVELFKNGSWISSKYCSHRVVLQKSPGVILFSNQQLSLHGLSNDRNITMELWADQKTGEIKYYVRAHTPKEFTNSIIHKGQPTFRCPRLDTWVAEDEVIDPNPSHVTVNRLHVDGFDECWCVSKAGYDLCGPLTPNEKELYFQENGACAEGFAPYAVCPPVTVPEPQGENSESLLANVSVEKPLGGNADAAPKPYHPCSPGPCKKWSVQCFASAKPAATSTPKKTSPTDTTGPFHFSDFDDEFNLHSFDENMTCTKCGIENPGNQLCNA